MSSQSIKSEIDLLDTTLPSPVSSVKSNTISQKSSTTNSRRTSPSTDQIDDSSKTTDDDTSNKRRRSTRISQLDVDQQRQKRLEKEAEINSVIDNDDTAELVLKRRKFDDKDNSTQKVVSLSMKDGKLHFNEPSLEEPIMSVTGLPLNAPPNSKVKKESLWPRKKSKKQTSQQKPSDEVTPEVNHPTPDESESSSNYKKSLKTNLNESLQKPSDIRQSNHLKPVPKKGLNSTPSTSSNPRIPTKSKSKEKDDSKRKIKNSSPKKSRPNAFGFDNPIQTAGTKRENAFDFNDTTKDNDDFCSACGEPGIFLCCEACPKSFHFACCNPPYDEDNLPEDEWFCNDCSYKKNKKSTPSLITQHLGLFGKLLNQIDSRNPIQFQLPKRIRERFEGVVTGDYGEYEDTDYKSFKLSQLNNFEQTDIDNHFDKKTGDLLICVKCGESGLNYQKHDGINQIDKSIIQCEYCPTSWHLDCLDPPLSTVKQLGKKWKCPNHSDHLLADKQRRLKVPKIVDVDQSRGFKNNGDIEVSLNEDSDNDEEVDVVEIPVPSYLKNKSVKNGISAEIPKTLLKIWNDPFIIHRIPENGIVLDFLGKVIDSKKYQNHKINETLKLTKENNQLLNRLINSKDYDDREKQSIGSLIDLKFFDFDQLVNIATDELSTNISNGSSTSCTTLPYKKDQVEQDELEELRLIKKLISVKGKDKLLEFLQS